MPGFDQLKSQLSSVQFSDKAGSDLNEISDDKPNTARKVGDQDDVFMASDHHSLSVQSLSESKSQQNSGVSLNDIDD